MQNRTDNENCTMLDLYLKEKNFDISPEKIAYKRIVKAVKNMIKISNFILIPIERTICFDKDKMTTNRIYRCRLMVNDKNLGGGIIQQEITIEQKHLTTFDTFKNHIQLQQPLAQIRLEKKSDKEKYIDNVRIAMLEGFSQMFGIGERYEVPRIGFEDGGSSFIFNNGILKGGKFTPGIYKLGKKVSTTLIYPEQMIENLDLETSKKELLSLSKYISNDKAVSAIIPGYMIGGIFRQEFKAIHNEFAFLGIEGYSGIGKTSLLNFLSWIAGYNWDTIQGVCDSEYAFEVGMDTLASWFYFCDEIQKASPKFLKNIQAAYNGGANHKGGANGKRDELEEYKKDTSLICSGEMIPQGEEALLNRFIIIDQKECYLLKQAVTDKTEFEKYEKIYGKPVASDYMNTEENRKMAEYYRCHFLNLLRNKGNINFIFYHNKAEKLIDIATKDMVVDTRFKNNLLAAITGHLILLGADCDDNNVVEIVRDYFLKLEKYRSKSIISGKLVDNIISNPDKFCSWFGKVKFGKSNPRIYVKHTDTEKGMYIKLKEIAEDAKDTLECQLKTSHITQQFMALLGLNDNNSYSKSVCVAGGDIKVDTKRIPLATIQQNDYLQRIWDVALEYSYEHIGELNQLINENKDTSMQKTTLEKLSNEMITTYFSASFFSPEKREEHEKLKKELSKIETTI